MNVAKSEFSGYIFPDSRSSLFFGAIITASVFIDQWIRDFFRTLKGRVDQTEIPYASSFIRSFIANSRKQSESVQTDEKKTEMDWIRVYGGLIEFTLKKLTEIDQNVRSISKRERLNLSPIIKISFPPVNVLKGKQFPWSKTLLVPTDMWSWAECLFIAIYRRNKFLELISRRKKIKKLKRQVGKFRTLFQSLAAFRGITVDQLFERPEVLLENFPTTVPEEIINAPEDDPTRQRFLRSLFHAGRDGAELFRRFDNALDNYWTKLVLHCPRVLLPHIVNSEGKVFHDGMEKRPLTLKPWDRKEWEDMFMFRFWPIMREWHLHFAYDASNPTSHLKLYFNLTSDLFELRENSFVKKHEPALEGESFFYAFEKLPKRLKVHFIDTFKSLVKQLKVLKTANNWVKKHATSKISTPSTRMWKTLAHTTPTVCFLSFPISAMSLIFGAATVNDPTKMIGHMVVDCTSFGERMTKMETPTKFFSLPAFTPVSNIGTGNLSILLVESGEYESNIGRHRLHFAQNTQLKELAEELLRTNILIRELNENLNGVADSKEAQLSIAETANKKCISSLFPPIPSKELRWIFFPGFSEEKEQYWGQIEMRL